MINSKKAQEGITLAQAIGIIMAVIGILALTVLIARLSKPFLGKQEYDASKNNFDELTDKVQELLDNKKDFVAERNFPYFIDEKYSIIGFDKEKDYVIHPIGQSKIFKPSSCYENACLCLYNGQDMIAGENNKNNKDKGVLDCKSLKENIVFYGGYSKQKKLRLSLRGLDYSDEFLNLHGMERSDIHQDLMKEELGKDDYRYFMIHNRRSKEKWKVQNIYIEKYKAKDGKIYVYITIEDDDIDDRYEALKQKTAG